MRLQVDVVEGKDIMDSDGKKKKCDGYAVLQVGQEEQRTKVKDDTNTPEWNESFTFELGTVDQVLKITVKDLDFLNNDFIGALEFNIADLVKAPVEGWFPLEGHKGKYNPAMRLRLRVVGSAPTSSPLVAVEQEETKGDAADEAMALAISLVDDCIGVAARQLGHEEEQAELQAKAAEEARLAKAAAAAKAQAAAAAKAEADRAAAAAKAQAQAAETAKAAAAAKAAADAKAAAAAQAAAAKAAASKRAAAAPKPASKPAASQPPTRAQDQHKTDTSVATAPESGASSTLLIGGIVLAAAALGLFAYFRSDGETSKSSK
mmetsp:Transcript_6758/g.7547  ORF Transcript_6758/g.7547 Transcript_6758/m.7547 type:complete len:319 (+) Transcript_6758:32-988(+)